MEKILELIDVGKKYKNGSSHTVALQKINYTLPAGESLAIEGASGSGKSTLLNLIGGLDKPNDGKVIIDGKDITKLNDSKLSQFRNQTIGFVFQFFNLQDYLSATENVMIPLLINGVNSKEAKERAVELLKSVGLEKRANYFPKQMSGGEMQRVAVARSLANNPKILLADEPTANLDRASADKIMDLFSEIKNKGITVIAVTHDSIVSQRFRNVIHIRDGKILTTKD
jgi:putative ABC transport system ATP-binding protein